MSQEIRLSQALTSRWLASNGVKVALRLASYDAGETHSSESAKVLAVLIRAWISTWQCRMLLKRVLPARVIHCNLLCIVTLLAAATADTGGHTSNWAVIVNTSRYWFNYRLVVLPEVQTLLAYISSSRCPACFVYFFCFSLRHVANALSIYTTVKR